MPRLARFRRPEVLLLLLLLLPAFTIVAERVVGALWSGTPAEIAGRRCAATLYEAQRGFAELETDLRKAGARANVDSGVVAFLSGAIPDRAALFERLGRLTDGGEIGLEVYDRYGVCAAWVGRSGPDHAQEIQHALGGREFTGVERTPLFAELYCALPVRTGSDPIGVILARRILGVNYPFTNRILTRSGIDEQLSAKLGSPVEFRFAGDQEPWGLARRHTGPLYGSDSVVVGLVAVGCPEEETLKEETRETFQRFHALALLPALILLPVVAWKRISHLRSAWVRFLLLTGLIWGLRGVLLALGVTETLAPAWMLDRSLYATSMFWGLAGSPADLLLTGLAALVNVFLPVFGLRSDPGESRARRAGSMLLGGMLAVLLPAAMAAVTRSLVMDSTSNFSDASVLLPGAGQVLLILAGLLFALTFLTTMSSAFLAALRSFKSESSPLVWIAVMVLTAAVGEAASAIFFGGLVPAGSAAALIVSGGILGFARAKQRLTVRGMTGGEWLVALVVSGVILHICIAPAAQMKDRKRIEALAADVLRPVDSWFRGVVADGLQGFSSDAVLGVLDQGDPEETRRVAFTVWAHSLACREGCASVFAVTDAGGQVISRFSIGGQSFRLAQEDLPVMPGPSATVREVGNGVGAVRMYSGSVPLRDAAGNTLGFGRVLVAAARQTLFRGETPAIFRSTSREGLETFHRKVSLAEYREGVLVPSEGNVMPLGSALPASVPGRLDASPQGGVWLQEQIENRSLETYYVRGADEPARVVALSMEKPGVQWHVASLLRILAGCFVLLAVVSVVLFIKFLRSGNRPVVRFRHRLLGAFLLLSVLPMGAVVFYAQWFAGERLVERTSRELSADTRDIAERVAPLLGGTIDRRPAVDRDVERIATDRNTDFNLYLGEELLASSAPTLYEAGILDRRLSAGAYRQVVLGGHPFVMLTERIGEYRFAVGYRALVDSVGTVLAVIAAPTVFRQDELDNEVAGTTTFIAALALAVLLIVVVAAATIAQTIAAPIQDLTEATARVARGDLDAVVRKGRTGGEVGVLVRSFERMTHELKTSRDALIRYERELAWKDMAKQVAHEINNPLTPMKLLLQHLGRAYRDGAEDFGALLERVLRTVIGQIDQLGRIAAEFSHFARMPKRIIEPSSVRQIVDEVVELYSKELRVRFTIDMPQSLPAVPVDRDELRRAFINVVRNGVQAMNGEGSVEIRGFVRGKGIAVEITDHGPGMSEEVRARAFEAGFTTKRDGSGVGLGLVKSTMDELGGTVTIASTPGQGTTVTLWIPLEIEGREGGEG